MFCSVNVIDKYCVSLVKKTMNGNFKFEACEK